MQNTQPSQITIHAYTDEDRAAWGQFVMGESRATFYHQICWKDIIEKTYGCKTYYLIAKKTGRVRGVLPLVKILTPSLRPVLISLPFSNYGGILAQSQEVSNMLIQEIDPIAGDQRVDYVELKHPYRCPHPILQDKLWYQAPFLELDEDWDKVWKRKLQSKTRNQVRKAEKYGLQAKIGMQYFEPFCQVYFRNMRDLGTPTHGWRWFHNLATYLDGNMTPVVTFAEDKPVSGVLLFFFKDTVLVQYGASLKEYLAYCPNNLSYWTAIRYSCEQGYRIFDFGRSRTGSGTFEFKLQWGAEPCQTYYQYILKKARTIPDMDPTNPKYKVAIGLWKRLPVSLCVLFGPILRQHITT